MRSFSSIPGSPIARIRPSPQWRDGSWQVAQEMVRDCERTGAKNSVRPSSTWAGVSGPPSGTGSSDWRAKAPRHAAASSLLLCVANRLAPITAATETVTATLLKAQPAFRVILLSD